MTPTNIAIDWRTELAKYRVRYSHCRADSPNSKSLDKLTVTANSKSEAIAKAKKIILNGTSFKSGHRKIAEISATLVDNKKPANDLLGCTAIIIFFVIIWYIVK